MHEIQGDFLAAGCFDDPVDCSGCCCRGEQTGRTGGEHGRMDLFKLRCNRKQRELLLQLRYAKTGGGVGMYFLRSCREYR